MTGYHSKVAYVDVALIKPGFKFGAAAGGGYFKEKTSIEFKLKLCSSNFKDLRFHKKPTKL